MVLQQSKLELSLFEGLCQGLSKARDREEFDSKWFWSDSSGFMTRAVLINAFLSWPG